MNWEPEKESESIKWRGRALNIAVRVILRKKGGWRKASRLTLAPWTIHSRKSRKRHILSWSVNLPQAKRNIVLERNEWIAFPRFFGALLSSIQIIVLPVKSSLQLRPLHTCYRPLHTLMILTAKLRIVLSTRIVCASVSVFLLLLLWC